MKTSGPIYSYGHIDDNLIKIIWDTGAGTSILHSNFALNLPINKINYKITGISGQSFSSPGSVTTTLDINGNLFKHTFLVHSSCPVDCILGNDFLYNIQPQINYKNKTITIGKHTPIPFDYIKDQSDLRTSRTMTQFRYPEDEEKEIIQLPLIIEPASRPKINFEKTNVEIDNQGKSTVHLENNQEDLDTNETQLVYGVNNLKHHPRPGRDSRPWGGNLRLSAVENAKERQKAEFDKRHTSTTYKIEEKVNVHNERRKRRKNPIIQSHYFGHHEIIKQDNPVIYTVTPVNGPKAKKKLFLKHLHEELLSDNDFTTSIENDEEEPETFPTNPHYNWRTRKKISYKS